MKKQIQILAIAIALFAASSYADEFLPRSYYVEAGIGAVATKGDFNDVAITAKDSTGIQGRIHPPALDIFATPDFTIGANIGPFSLGLNFQIWNSEQVLAGFAKDSVEEDSRIWRLGFEFTYNFYWPEFFQAGLGLGYSFANIKTENSAYFSDNAISNSELYGSAVSFIAYIRYYITENIAFAPTIRIYESWFKNVYTSRTDNCDLDPYLWQTFVMASFALHYQF
ncbi:MAG: outer membrane beta-barrel protein [Fibrobacter sp.]|nr:outer membrane beta-barrel protein [Fibrobacter sp.]